MTLFHIELYPSYFFMLYYVMFYFIISYCILLGYLLLSDTYSVRLYTTQNFWTTVLFFWMQTDLHEETRRSLLHEGAGPAVPGPSIKNDLEWWLRVRQPSQNLVSVWWMMIIFPAWSHLLGFPSLGDQGLFRSWDSMWIASTSYIDVNRRGLGFDPLP